MSLRKPEHLDETASKFWTRHAKRLQDQGLLRESTMDAFVLLCKTHSHLLTADPNKDHNGWLKYFALLKSYQSYARGFCMSTDKVVRVVEAVAEVDEFGLGGK